MDPWTCPACGGKNRVGLAHCLRCGKPAPRLSTPASQHAEQFVAQARQGPFFKDFPEALDFSAESLVRLDAVINAMFGPDGRAVGQTNWQPQGMILQTVIDFGAYVGEVLCRALPVHWQMHPQFPQAVIQARVVDAQGRVINTFAQVALRFRDGANQPIAALFTALTGRRLPAWAMPQEAAGIVQEVPPAEPLHVPSAPNAATLDAGAIATIFQTCRAHIERGHFGNVVLTMKPLIGIHLETAELGTQAELLIQAEAFEPALVALQELAAREPQSERWPELWCLVLTRLGRLDQAQGVLSKALRQFPTSASLPRRQAFLQLKSRQYDLAELALLKLLRSHPDEVELLIGLAEAQLQQGRAQDALVSLQRVLRVPQLSPQHRHAATEQINRIRGGHSAAVRPATPAAAPEAPVRSPLAPEPSPEAEVHASKAYNQAIALAREKRFPEALPWFKRAVELDAFNATHWKDFGNCMKDCGHPEPARACLEHALKLDPNYTLARYLIGECFEAEKRTEQAIACYRQILNDLKSDPRWVDRAFTRLQVLGAA
ncbi:tetratricopeptide repeat protein [Ahniella affigens]|nr:tetratricopeptide repeat protein [Ahniella affigens]